MRYQGSEFLAPRVRMVGDAALLTYNYRSTSIELDGSTVQTPWNTTEVYFRREGRWQIVHAHWSFVNQRLPESVDMTLPVLSQTQSYEGVLGELMALETRAMQRWRTGDTGGFLESATRM